SPKVKVVVYLYNSFSFSDNFYSTAYTMRWNTAEFVRMADRRILRSTPNSAIAEAIMRELFFVYRYKTFLSYFLTEAWSNGLVEHIYPTDAYGPGPTPPIRKREKAKLADPNYELTRWYLDSDSGKMTLGYASLIRFAKLAKERSIRLIVMPVPEPEFSNLGEYKQYISTARIDAKVAEICKQNGIDYVPRKESQDFEANDTYFGDNFHMHILGRIKYSEWIAGRVASILGARSYMPVHDKERTVQHS
ncbi:MAG: hypothetical protein P4M14_01005, partial [Gammaproteobacteria bacterium]|nr:hypothetical protein [Gammaproteobacteria bacterium]